MKGEGLVRMERVCTNCKTKKSISDYYGHERVKADGEKYIYYNPQCKSCLIEKANKWHKENADKKFAYRRRYYYENKDMHDKSNLKWRNSGGQRDWQRRNKDKLKEYSDSRMQNKSHKINTQEWEDCKKYFNHRCAYCGIAIENHIILFNRKYINGDFHKEHVDHEGSNDLSNCVPSCKSCNSSKSNLLFDEWYNENNVSFSKERCAKIVLWLSRDYRSFIASNEE